MHGNSIFFQIILAIKNWITITICCCCEPDTTMVVFAELGLIPPWVARLCWLSSAFVRKPSPHAVHGYGWSPVCNLYQFRKKHSMEISRSTLNINYWNLKKTLRRRKLEKEDKIWYDDHAWVKWTEMIKSSQILFTHRKMNDVREKKRKEKKSIKLWTYNLIWATSVRFCKNSFPHTVQECGTRPWMRPWLTNWNLRGNVAPQSEQTNGFSDPWNRECMIRWFSCAKLSPHSSQTYGRSPAWNLLCVTKWRFNGNERPHSWQINGLSRLFWWKKKQMRKERNGWLVSVHLKRAFGNIPMKIANVILPVNSWMR